MTSKKFHYVYRITNLLENKHYYGKRSSNIEPKLDLGIHYFSSSHDKLFITEQKHKPQNFKYKIIRCFDSAKEAVGFEIKLHNKFDVGVNASFYNRAKQTSKTFDVTGKVAVKDKDGNIFHVSINDPRYISGEFVHVIKGKVTVKDKDGNIKQMLADDPRYISGEFVHINTGMVTVKNKNGETIQMSVYDPRISSGEFTHISTGMVTVKNKNGETIQMSVYDPRILSGEFEHINKGLTRTPETRRKISEAGRGRYVSKETRQKMSERRLGREVSNKTKELIKNANIGLKFVCKEIDGNTIIKRIKSELVTSYINNGWSIGRKLKQSQLPA